MYVKLIERILKICSILVSIPIITVLICTEVSAQKITATQATAQSRAGSKVEVQSSQKTLESGTEIQAELKSTLNLKKAEKGAPFSIKTTRHIKRDGDTVLNVAINQQAEMTRIQPPEPPSDGSAPQRQSGGLVGGVLQTTSDLILDPKTNGKPDKKKSRTSN